MVRETETEGDNKCSVSTIKFLCNYGGKIVPRKSEGKLCYARVRMAKPVEFCRLSVVLRCPLPNCDVETLVAIKSDEALANLVEEYKKASSSWPCGR